MLASLTFHRYGPFYAEFSTFLRSRKKGKNYYCHYTNRISLIQSQIGYSFTIFNFLTEIQDTHFISRNRFFVFFSLWIFVLFFGTFWSDKTSAQNCLLCVCSCYLINNAITIALLFPMDVDTRSHSPYFSRADEDICGGGIVPRVCPEAEPERWMAQASSSQWHWPYRELSYNN